MIYIIGEALQLSTKQVGGKSCHLNDLKSKGLPVPAGIIVDDSYFKEASKENLLTYLSPVKKYAVRSSALDEDGANFSFAGLQDTYLNVDYDDITWTVEACYQSQFNERATDYRKKIGINESKGMSVIVEEMVDADLAGVIFTQNPMTNRIDQVVIEVVSGLGEALVSGHTRPSTYTVMKNSHEVVEVKKHGSILSQDNIKHLMEYGKKIEDIYNGSQDIEFAIKDDAVFILQARPITTTTKVPIRENEGLRFYISFAHVQNMMYPITPVGAEYLQSIFTYNDHPMFKGRIVGNGEFLFVDISDFLQTPDFIFKKIMTGMKNINFELPELAMQYRRMNSKRKMLPISVFLLGAKFGRKVFKLVNDNNPSSDYVIKYLENHYKRFENYNKKELMEFKSDVLFSLFKELIPYLGAGMFSFSKVEKLLKKSKVERSDFVKIVKGIEGNITAEMGLLYDDLLRHYGTDEGEKLFQTYMDKFGTRTDGEIDLGRPRPIDDLPKFKKQLEKMAEVHSGIALRQKHELSILEGEEVMQKLKNKLAPGEYKKLQHWLGIMKAYYSLREHPKHTMMRIFQIYRQYITSPFETFEEKQLGGIDETLINKRKELYNEAFGKRIPIAMLSNGLILQTSKKTQDGSIVGFGVSSGIIEAKVRVIENIHDDMIQDGEILVTRFTDPGWTPMLAKAGGIVTEVGGMMTHGAIVAREYGIPAVVGIVDAVKLFKTGEVITMDGDSGIIVKK